MLYFALWRHFIALDRDGTLFEANIYGQTIIRYGCRRYQDLLSLRDICLIDDPYILLRQWFELYSIGYNGSRVDQIDLTGRYGTWLALC